MSEQDRKILIVNERRFMALYIANLLEGSDFEVLASLSDLDDLQEVSPEECPALCIVGSGTPAISELCATLRVRFPDSHLVMIDADNFEGTGSLARDLGLDGCLSLDLAPHLLQAGLSLVAAGTRCFPKFDTGKRRHMVRRVPGCGKRDAMLTPREKAVLALIVEGMANKVIARELDISESTVKAHLNAVLRKTGTTNRTQAARWAFVNGEAAQP